MIEIPYKNVSSVVFAPQIVECNLYGVAEFSLAAFR